MARDLATVNDILDSVEETLSEYNEKIQRIEAENESLRRSLQGLEDVNRGGKKEVELPKQSRGNLKHEPVQQQPGDSKQDLKDHHRYQQQEPSGSVPITKHDAESSLQAQEATAGSVAIKKASDCVASLLKSENVKHDPDLEQNCAMDLSTTHTPPSMEGKRIKFEKDEQEFLVPEHDANMQAPQSPDLDSRDGDCDVSTTIISDHHLNIGTRSLPQNCSVVPPQLLKASPALCHGPVATAVGRSLGLVKG
ncbi:hypothetical protein COCON_G00155950 [Conger conger]|uniref:Uncharacterized protein n=1 Tax=Conger conger TaxID=82655 RepID=A0A9Q1HV39_CONCO|nr:hypothetical protein COCON_G00155950 [Conger conger]